MRTDDFAPGSIAQTDFAYTGQRNVDGLGLMDYKARFYDAALGRFIQPDTIVPNAADPQSWNRYSYVVNNPIRLSDPTGQRVACGVMGEACDSDKVSAKLDKKGKDGDVGPSGGPIPLDPYTIRYPANMPYRPVSWEGVLYVFDMFTGAGPVGDPNPIADVINLAVCGGRCPLEVQGALVTLNWFVHGTISYGESQPPYYTPTRGPSPTPSATVRPTMTLTPRPTGTSPYVTPTYQRPAATQTPWLYLP